MNTPIHDYHTTDTWGVSDCMPERFLLRSLPGRSNVSLHWMPLKGLSTFVLALPGTNYILWSFQLRWFHLPTSTWELTVREFRNVSIEKEFVDMLTSQRKICSPHCRVPKGLGKTAHSVVSLFPDSLSSWILVLDELQEEGKRKDQLWCLYIRIQMPNLR